MLFQINILLLILKNISNQDQAEPFAESIFILLEKLSEIQTYKYAQEIIALPENEKEVALKMIREEIQKRQSAITT